MGLSNRLQRRNNPVRTPGNPAGTLNTTQNVASAQTFPPECLLCTASGLAGALGPRGLLLASSLRRALRVDRRRGRTTRRTRPAGRERLPGAGGGARPGFVGLPAGTTAAAAFADGLAGTSPGVRRRGLGCLQTRPRPSGGASGPSPWVPMSDQRETEPTAARSEVPPRSIGKSAAALLRTGDPPHRRPGRAPPIGQSVPGPPGPRLTDPVFGRPPNSSAGRWMHSRHGRYRRQKRRKGRRETRQHEGAGSASVSRVPRPSQGARLLGVEARSFMGGPVCRFKGSDNICYGYLPPPRA